MREPPVTSWVPLTQSELGVRVRALLAKTTRALVLVDGRSGAGKSTFAHRLAQVLDAAVVHTDDIARQHSRFGWSEALLDGVDGTPPDQRPDLTWVTRGPLGA